MIVCKFGGTSVASEKTAKNIKQIVKSNKNRKFVVVSAIGKQGDKIKVTDLLFKLYFKIINNESYIGIVDEIFERYKDLSNALNVKINWQMHKDQFIKNIKKFNKEYIVSRGEYYSALLYAKYLNATFLDAKDYIKFKKNKFNERLTKKCLSGLNKNKVYVIGGFYGQDINGNICVFDRGGSDITGAIICKLLNCDIYENYTDVDGVYNKNPALFKSAKKLPLLCYKTAILMAKCGNEVVHIDALKTMKNSNAILVVKSTLLPDNLGTIVVQNNTDDNNVYICKTGIIVVKINTLNLDDINLLKQKASILKIFKFKNTYYVLLNNLYVSEQIILKLKNVLSVQNLQLFTVFSNNLLPTKTVNLLSKIKSKLSKINAQCLFLSYNNNFVILCPNNKSNIIVDKLNYI